MPHGAGIPSGASVGRTRSQRWSHGWPRTTARSRPAPSSTFRAAEPGTDLALASHGEAGGVRARDPAVDESQHQAAEVAALVGAAGIRTGRIEAPDREVVAI